MPSDLVLPDDAPIRYSVRRDEARERRERLPERLEVDPQYFLGKNRG
jgi:hypothetical protein